MDLRKQFSLLRKRTEAEWLYQIFRASRYGTKLRAKLCGIVWWDYCEALSSANVLKEESKKECEGKEPTELELKKALIKIGYPETIAHERARPKEYIKPRVSIPAQEQPKKRGRPKKKI